MGCTGSKDNTAASKSSDSSAKKEEKARKKNPPLKLLLLGAPQTGKSTFLKQLQFNFLKGFADEQRAEIIRSLRDNLVVGFRDIIEYAEKENQDFADSSKAAVAYFKEVSLADEAFDETIIKHAKTLWKDTKMQSLWDKKDTISTLLVMNLDYIMDNIDRIGAKDAIANDEDILRSRQRTMQSNQISFEYKGHNFEVTDVGGQKTSRRRWSQVVENPTAIIYFAALSDYDIKSFDGESTKFQESVDIWKTVVETPSFSQSVLILMLNKFDIFKEKLANQPYKKFNKKYEGKDSPEDVAEYLKDFYFRVVPEDRQENFMSNVTCALDTSQMKTVFNSIQINITDRAINDAFG